MYKYAWMFTCQAMYCAKIPIISLVNYSEAELAHYRRWLNSIQTHRVELPVQECLPCSCHRSSQNSFWLVDLQLSPRPEGVEWEQAHGYHLRPTTGSAIKNGKLYTPLIKSIKVVAEHCLLPDNFIFMLSILFFETWGRDNKIFW